MPSPNQRARLKALEAQTPGAARGKPDLSPAEIRSAVQSLLEATDGGYDDRDPLHRWAWSATDAELSAWWTTPADAPGAAPWYGNWG